MGEPVTRRTILMNWLRPAGNLLHTWLWAPQVWGMGREAGGRLMADPEPSED